MTSIKVGGEAFHELLSSIEVKSEIEKLNKEIPKATSVSKRDSLIKKLKYLNGLSSMELKPEEAYVIRNMPVVPPRMRPAIPMSGNRLEFSDINMLYKDHMLVNNSLHELKDILPPEELHNERRDLYNGAKAVMGFGDPISPASKGRDLKGLALQISGVSGPKRGFFQNKVLGKKQDFSGRATITNNPMLGLNELGVPVEMLWSMYKMHIIRDLVKKGYPYVEAEKSYEAKNDAANTSFKKVVEDIPIILNRAPTLMKSNISAFKATPVEGKTLQYNPLNLKLIAGDYDGDAVSLFLPTTPEAITEAKEKMMPQSQLFDYRKGLGSSLIHPDHEAIIGAIHLSEPDMTQKIVHFKSEKEALKALKEGKIKDNTPIIIDDHDK